MKWVALLRYNKSIFKYYKFYFHLIQIHVLCLQKFFTFFFELLMKIRNKIQIQILSK